ncbi:MAG: hypothetical protein CDV28_13226 [Candidatus Electronema aureum]|uniref:Tetratricopeptide repeat-containing protein n=1 Tax=Candidatus Electronema aureum TaxID=2005002 RepID=A0A521FZW1_9BACT|nr:MAG: hypothetical protein CDV28_13226 [Candidatus Electronema aureum]
MKARLIWLMLVLVLVCGGCSADPNEKANKLYVEASQLLQSAQQRKEKDFSADYAAYQDARKTIDAILTDYPASTVAVGLLSGQTKILGLTLRQFQEKEEAVKLLAEAEQSPLEAAFVVAEAMEGNTHDKAVALTVALIAIAENHAEAGKNEKATALLEQLEKTIKGNGFELSMFSHVAISYAKIGQKEKGERLLSQLLKQENDNKNDSVLQSISIGYAICGNISRAIDIANKIDEPLWKSLALATVANEIEKKENNAAEIRLQAIDIAAHIKEPAVRARVLLLVADGYAKSGQKEKSLEMFSKSYELIDEKRRNDPSYNDRSYNLSLMGIATHYAEAGFFDQAKEIIDKILDDSEKIPLLARIAVKTGQKEDAARLLAKFIGIVRDGMAKVSGDSSWRWQSNQLVQIAKMYAEAGIQPGAKEKAILLEIVHSAVKTNPLFAQAQ